MQLRNWLEFSSEENKVFLIFEEKFQNYIDMYIGNENKTMNVIFEHSEIIDFDKIIEELEELGYEMKNQYLPNEKDDSLLLVFDLPNPPKRSNRIGIYIVKKYDNLFRIYRNSTRSKNIKKL